MKQVMGGKDEGSGTVSRGGEMFAVQLVEMATLQLLPGGKVSPSLEEQPGGGRREAEGVQGAPSIHPSIHPATIPSPGKLRAPFPLPAPISLSCRVSAIGHRARVITLASPKSLSAKGSCDSPRGIVTFLPLTRQAPTALTLWQP